VEQQQPQVSAVGDGHRGSALTPVASGPVSTGSPAPTSSSAPASVDPKALERPQTDSGSDSWPAVPPAPAPVKPAPPPAAPEPPILSSPPPVTAIRFPGSPVPAPRAAAAEDDPTIAIAPTSPTTTTTDTTDTTADIGPEPTPNSPGAGTVWTAERSEERAERQGKTVPLGPRTRASGASAEGPESPLLQLQRTVRRQQTVRPPGRDLVWQPRFAYSSALVILLALTVVSMPLWIVLYRITDTAGGGPPVADLVALCMMLLGGFLTGAAAWVIIIEMRGRVRMVDTLAKTGEREAMIAPAAPELPVLDAPFDVPADPVARREPVWDPDAAAATHQARVEAQQVNAASMLEASSKLLTAFSNVLRSFGQLPAQVAMLAVALSLFVGATVLSLR
jgi:hypothetical protein